MRRVIESGQVKHYRKKRICIIYCMFSVRFSGDITWMWEAIGRHTCLFHQLLHCGATCRRTTHVADFLRNDGYGRLKRLQTIVMMHFKHKYNCNCRGGGGGGAAKRL